MIHIILSWYYDKKSKYLYLIFCLNNFLSYLALLHQLHVINDLRARHIQHYLFSAPFIIALEVSNFWRLRSVGGSIGSQRPAEVAFNFRRHKADKSSFRGLLMAGANQNFFNFYLCSVSINELEGKEKLTYNMNLAANRKKKIEGLSDQIEELK